MKTAHPKPCSTLKHLVIGQTDDGRYVYGTAKYGRLRLTYWFTTHGPSALKGEYSLPDHIDVRTLPAEFQQDGVPLGQRVINALNAGWAPLVDDADEAALDGFAAECQAAIRANVRSL